jgi:nucleoside 2-deoxyribosyltransferase
MGDQPLIYFAAPLFNETERAFNARISTRLEQYAPVFLPQRDGELLVELIQSGVQPAIAERRVFQNDLRAIRGASLTIAVLDGAHVDEGVAFEIGYSNGVGVKCIGLQTDVRRALPSGNNPMIAQGLDRVFSTADILLDWVHAWSVRWAPGSSSQVA